MLLILEAVTFMTVAMNIALLLSMSIVPMAWCSAFRPHPTPVGHFSPLSRLLCLPLSDFHSLFLTNDFVWLDFFLISLEYFSGIRLLMPQGRGICTWLLIISLGYDCLGDTDKRLRASMSFLTF